MSSIAAYLQLSFEIADFFQPNNHKRLVQKDGEHVSLVQFAQYKASLSSETLLMRDFWMRRHLPELAVIKWAAKGKLFVPIFFSLVDKGRLRFILYLCSLCRFIEGRCFALCLVIPIVSFDFSRCVWNCQLLGFLLLCLDKVGLREVSYFLKKSCQ